MHLPCLHPPCSPIWTIDAKTLRNTTLDDKCSPRSFAAPSPPRPPSPTSSPAPAPSPPPPPPSPTSRPATAPAPPRPPPSPTSGPAPAPAPPPPPPLANYGSCTAKRQGCRTISPATPNGYAFILRPCSPIATVLLQGCPQDGGLHQSKGNVRLHNFSRVRALYCNSC